MAGIGTGSVADRNPDIGDNETVHIDENEIRDAGIERLDDDGSTVISSNIDNSRVADDHRFKDSGQREP